MPPGLFITFEGGEGSGKSTQIKLLQRRLQRRKIPVTVVREPGGTPLGDRLRYLLKFSNIPLTPEAELLLFNASRGQLVADVMRPALERGEVVLCDRFTDSTLAYQGYGRGIPLRSVETVNGLATGGLKPHLTIFLDIPPADGLERQTTDGDRFERGAAKRDIMDFHQRVHQGYLALARGEPGLWAVVNARLPKREVSKLIWQRVGPLVEWLGRGEKP
jgi:dTMP kinase